MINFKLKDKEFSIPTQWEEVTLIQYCEILKMTPSSISLISIFTGIDYETLKNSVIIGLDQILIAIQFTQKTPVIPMPEKVGPYKINKPEIKFESLAMFEDMKQAMINAPKDLPGLTRSYADICAMYLQKQRDGEYSYQKAKDMVKDVEQYPAVEVIGLASFFLMKLISLTSGIAPSSQISPPSQKKKQRVTRNSRRHSGPTARSRKRR